MRCSQALSRCFPVALFATVFLCFALHSPAQTEEPNMYVGSKACADCHEEQYANFTKYAKKATSAHSVQVMAHKLSKEELEGCYSCHTTGYGKPGGFISYEKTPHLGDAGCEVCHGPGQQHIDEDGDPDLITMPTMENCTHCHNEERVRSFGFRPLLHGGAH